jgi:hypothetical protein
VIHQLQNWSNRYFPQIRLIIIAGIFLMAFRAEAGVQRESECHLAEEAAYYGLESLEHARAAIPKLFVSELASAELRPEDAVPADVLKDPANRLAEHYEAHARMIFVNPWTLASETKKKDERTFLVAMKEGNLLKGELPVGLPRTEGTYKNYIRFRDPIANVENYLFATHTYETKKQKDGLWSEIEGETIFSGSIATVQDKYVSIQVELANERDYIELIHDQIALSIDSLQRRWSEEKRTTKAAVRFALDACRKIENPSERLKWSLDDLEKSIK